MKKKLRNSSFRKAVINGVLIFGGVALLTTGFATWVIGVNQATANDDVTNVTVATAEKNNLMLSFTLDVSNSTVHIGEAQDPVGEAQDPEADGNNFINIKGNTKTDFNVLPKIKLEVGDGVATKPTKITLAFNYEPDVKLGFSNYVQEVDNLKAGEAPTHGNTANYTLIDINTAEVEKKLTLPDYTTDTTATTVNDNWAVTKKEGVTTLEYKGGAIDVFTWGTFFNNEAPSVFYNDLYDAGTLQNTTEHVNLVAKQLDYLTKGFNNKTIVLTATAI